jgi:hypothetical protein
MIDKQKDSKKNLKKKKFSKLVELLTTKIVKTKPLKQCNNQTPSAN